MILIGATLDVYRSLKDKTLKITFETQEPTGEQLVQIAHNIGRFGFLAFKEDALKTNEIKMLESLKSDYEDTGKSKSQRMRAVLFRNFEQDPKGYKIFDDYYNHQMEGIINHFKNKLD
jgi:hypothetical protein